ncbi:MAG TPA: TadE/TadG family type IV pilus assembly protein [Candidatus Limnocylindria bacterium]
MEMALLLPLLLLLLVMSIDLGRAFFGWITLQNLSRIGANYAATHPDLSDWGPTSRYQELILRDAQAINCEPVAITDPVFTPYPAVFGGDVTVSVTCGFALLTPIGSALVGGSLELGAASTFPVRAGCPDCEAVSGSPPPPPPPPPPTACNREPNPFVGLSVGGARNAWAWAGFTGTFTPAAGADDGRTVTGRSINQVPDADGCLPHWTTVIVVFDPLPAQPDGACPSGTYVPNLANMTVGEAKTVWQAAGFLAENFLPDGLTGNLVIVTQTIGPAEVAPDGCADPASTVTVTTMTKPKADKQYCVVPVFIGMWSDDAQAAWTAAGFTTFVGFLTPELLPYIIEYQSLVGATWEKCGSAITFGPNPEGTP